MDGSYLRLIAATQDPSKTWLANIFLRKMRLVHEHSVSPSSDIIYDRIASDRLHTKDHQWQNFISATER